MTKRKLVRMAEHVLNAPVDVQDYVSNMTPNTARALGFDAGTRSMLMNKRTAWNREDRAAATAAYENALRFMPIGERRENTH